MNNTDFEACHGKGAFNNYTGGFLICPCASARAAPRCTTPHHAAPRRTTPRFLVLAHPCHVLLAYIPLVSEPVPPSVSNHL